MERKTSTSTVVWTIVIIVVIIGLIVWIVEANKTSNNVAVQDNTTTASTTLPADLTDANVTATSHTLYGDTFTLSNGQASISKGHTFSATSTPTSPVSYTLAKTGYGMIMASGPEGAVSVMYRNFGADIQQLAVFAFKDNNGSLVQVASGVVYTGDSTVQSVSVDKGIITLALLVVSPSDLANLPHYAQTPTEPVIMKLQVSGSNIVAAQQ